MPLRQAGGVGVAFGLPLFTSDGARLDPRRSARDGSAQGERGVGRLAQLLGDDRGPEGQDRSAVDLDWHVTSQAPKPRDGKI